MLDAIREHSKGWLAKVILAAIIIPFALFGIDSYLTQSGQNIPVATVNGEEISIEQYNKALADARDVVRNNTGGKIDPALLEAPKFKQTVLDRLISERLLNEEIKREKFAITDEQLSQFITNMPDFQKDGQFSQEKYDQLLKYNRLTPSEFEARMRANLALNQAHDSLSKVAYLPNQMSELAMGAALQEREVSVAEIKTADFLSGISINSGEVKTFYQKNQDKFKAPEQVKLAFVMLSANALVPAMQVTDNEVQKFYTENIAKFQGDEQRKASHILIGFGVGAKAEEKLAARKKAEEILMKVKSNPDDFEKLAKEYSQDPGSKEKGGDLGPIKRGEMVKPFEDALYAMKPGAISDLVESEFGYHIIKLSEIQGQGQDFNSVKVQVKAELMYQKALEKFSEQADSFNNMVYEQSGSLQPVAKAFGLPVQTSSWLSREEAAKFFKNDKLAKLVFTDEVIKEKRNTEAIEVAPNSLLSARLVDYKPAAIRSFEEVKAGIEEYLKLEKATILANAKGESALKNLRLGKTDSDLVWSAPAMINRENNQSLTELAVKNAFKMDAAKLPNYMGVADGNKGYLLIKLSRVNVNTDKDANNKLRAREELQRALAEEYMSAYSKSLRASSKIVEHKERLLTENTEQ